MIGKLIIPVPDTENGNFDYGEKINRETYEEMVYDRFQKTNKQVQGLMDSIDSGTAYEYGKRKDAKTNVKTTYDFIPSEALFLTASKKEYTHEKLDMLLASGKMSIMLVNINPNDIPSDAESELKYWISDAEKVLNDKTLDDKTKLKCLPLMSFGLEIPQGKYALNNCKMFENYSDKKFPLYFALIIEKITNI